ncbi:glycosyltransferase family 4 protein [Muricoccus nepalensis]|uniref:glycosyltransferase family 4 protein n=1 Tax=Muricoccus nepalensis TaxID=1854500 RepID=UPI0013872511|nr:glycosyltransferase family 4 protein [Roseomonas nepalensis]
MSGTAAPPDAPLLLHVFPTFAVGGAQVRFCAVANRFGPRWRHAVVSLDGHADCAARLAPEVPLELVPSPAAKGSGLKGIAQIAALLRRLRPATLVTSNWGSMDWVMAGLLVPGLRHVHTEDGFGPEESTGQKPRRVIARRVLLRRSTVVLPSETLLRSATDLWRLPPARLHHIPNGLDIGRFRPDGPAALPPAPGEGPLVGTVAALRAEKNIALLIRAAAVLLREGTLLRLAVIGDGEERASLEALARELGIEGSVLFAGAIPDPASAYRALDVFALSSTTEQMPFSILEAMATGLPVASTDVGDVGVMLAPENRPHLVAATGTPEGMAAALRPLLLDAALRDRLGRANRARAEARYDQETMFQAYAALFDPR